MSFKRLAPNPTQSQSESRAKRQRRFLQASSHVPSSKALPSVKVYIVQAKLDVPTLIELNALAETHAERVCSNAEDADVIVTVVGMRKRLERHVPWDIAVSIYVCAARVHSAALTQAWNHVCISSCICACARCAFAGCKGGLSWLELESALHEPLVLYSGLRMLSHRLYIVFRLMHSSSRRLSNMHVRQRHRRRV